MKCECGMVIGSNYITHSKSIYHNNYTTINKMMEEGKTISDIAKVLNITRERVRQLLPKGIKTNYSKHNQAVIRNKKAIEERPELRSLKEWAIVYDLKIDYLSVASNTYTFKIRSININGYKCIIKTRTKNGNYICIYENKESSNYDFSLYYIKDLDTWLVFPKGIVIGKTMFSLEPKISGGHSNRHDYVNYINAFYLLKEEK